MAKPTPPTLVVFVRHGQTPTTGKVLPGRTPGLHLGDTGRAQAADTAERIGTLGDIAAVYASPMERTQETAQPIARIAGRRVRTARGLIECDFGDWTGRRLADLRRKKEWRQVQTSPATFRFPGGESFLEMQTRMCTTVEALVARHRGERIVAVSHADTIKAAVAQAQGIHLDLFQRLVISPCSITPVLYGDGPPVVLSVNSTGRDLHGLAPQ